MNIEQLDSLLAAAKAPQATVRVNLRGDLQSEWEELDGRLATLIAMRSTMAPTPEEKELAQQIKDIEAEAADHTLELTLEAIPRRAWLALVAQHAPRLDSPSDVQLGFNPETFFDALVAQSIVSPDMTDTQVSQLLDIVTSKQFDNLVDAAWSLNRKDTEVSFSRAASQVIPESGEKSQRPSSSGSPRRASRAKNPRS